MSYSDIVSDGGMDPRNAAQPEALGELLTKFRQQASRYGELWSQCQGKGWPDKESDEFTTLRDEKLPATRAAILAMLASALTATEPSDAKRFNAAINFAIEQGPEAALFLDSWRHGDTSEWPEFAAIHATKGGKL